MKSRIEPTTRANETARPFSARRAGATLGEVIERECEAGGRQILSVRAGESQGLLFFRDGRLVHASAGRLSGEAALTDLLAWPEGTYQRGHAAWPTVESITVNCQIALLRAERGLELRAVQGSARRSKLERPPAM